MSRLLLALSATVALLAYAAVLPPGSDASVETRFLALVVTGVLAAICLLAQSPPIEALSAAPLVVAAAWVVPTGPLRGAVVWVVLLAAVCVAAFRSLRARVDLDFTSAAAIALSVQFLARPRLLLPLTLDLHRLTALLALPLVAAFALAVLARRYESRTLLLVVTPLIVVAPGFDTAATLALVSLALGEIGHQWLAPKLSWLPPAAIAILAFVWQPPTVFLLALLGIAASASHSWWRQGTVASLALLLWWAAPGLRPFHAFPVLLPIVLVIAPLAVSLTAPRPRWLSAAVLLAVAILVVPEPAAVIAPLALAALGKDRAETAADLATLWAA
ncbi:MAG TPA: hypothetical protein VKA53_10870, partial [Thermoanaerobaculia bacterium]|nr:hypothetical protein [Thermoanaerobaculia bacterium]